MRITINDQTVDYTLEDETNLFEVLVSLRVLVEAEGYTVISARTPLRELDLSAEADLKDIPISAVDVLHVQAESIIEKEHRDLAALSEFFKVLRNGIVAENPVAVKKVLENYPYVQRGLDAVLERNGVVSGEVSAAALDDLLSKAGLVENGTVEGEKREQLLAFLDALQSVLSSRMREMETPGEELTRAASDLSRSIEQLNEVSVMLQTGRDAEAMQAILDFVELSTKIIRLYPILKQTGGIDFTKVVVDDVSFPDFYAEFNGILSELIDAFTSEDSVLIGDLLEYEISPRLEKLRAYITLLTEG